MTQHTTTYGRQSPLQAVASAAPAVHSISYRPDIDGLRAVAVLSVLVFHAFPSVLRGGFIGVDIFFVISGFLISSIIGQALAEGDFSIRQFYMRRILRIFPALITVLAVAYAAGWILMPADEYARLATHIVSGAGFFSNFTYWKEAGYFDPAAETKPLLHLWSLAIEEQFYIVWPFVLFAANKLCRKRGLLLAALSVAAISFCLNLHAIYVKADTAGLYYSPMTRFWELLVGGILAYWHAGKGRKAVPTAVSSLASLCSAAGAGAIVIGLFCISSTNAFPGWWALLPTIGAAMLIGAGPQTWFNRNVLAHPAGVWLGLVSYPLYLWHWPLLSFAHHLAAGAPPASVRLVVVLLAVPLAWMTKRFIENPIRLQARHGRVSMLVACMALVAGIGIFTQYQQGLPWRYGTVELQREPGRFECEDRKKNSGCIFGNPSGKIVVVYGDSHAEHLTRALDEALGKEYLFYMVTNGSCFMGENVLRPDIGNQRDCRAAQEKLHSLRGKNIYAVIRSQRWHAYGGGGEASIRELVSDALLAGGLHPQRTIIVGSTADVGFDCEVSNYYALPFSHQRQCKPADDTRAVNRLFIRVTQALQVGEGVRFVYPYEKICPQDQCVAIEGHVSNYSDTHHLTKDAALLLMPDIARALR